MTPETSGSGRFRYRLVTLWDLMRPFRAAGFLNLMELLNILQMHKDAVHFNDRLGSLSQKMAKMPVAYPADLMAVLMKPTGQSDDLGAIRRPGLDSFTEFETDCIALELVASLATVRKLKTVISQPNSRYSDLYPLADELRGRLIDEMQSKCFWALTTKEREYYDRPRNGWDEIITLFPDSVIDVEEASKCFALSRYAAAIFHSVQIVEVGLIDLGEFIGVNDPHSGWSAVSNALDKIIAKKHQDRTAFERDNFKFLEQVQGTVAGLKNAWRNKISHVHGKLTLMTKDFSPEVAEEILYATRAFMRRLADGLPPKSVVSSVEQSS
jgi:hypothetical protein